MAGMGDGYVGNSADGVRIRRLEKQREEQQQRMEEARKKSAQGLAGLLQFGAATSEKMESAFKEQTVGLVTREQFVERRSTLRSNMEEEERARIQKQKEEEEERLIQKRMRRRANAPVAHTRLSFQDEMEDEEEEDEEEEKDGEGEAQLSHLPPPPPLPPPPTREGDGEEGGERRQGGDAELANGERKGGVEEAEDVGREESSADGGDKVQPNNFNNDNNNNSNNNHNNVNNDNSNHAEGQRQERPGSRAGAGENDLKKKRKLSKLGKDPTVETSFLPDREREAQEMEERERLKREWTQEQERIKNEPLEITYSYWDGAGHRRVIKVRKGDTISEFLRAVQQQLATEFREVRTASVENLLYIKEDLIIPHQYSFYELIVNKARGKSGPLFHFDVHEDIRTSGDARIEKDESHAGKIVERHWYDKNKHIFPASRWEIYDPTKKWDRYTVHGT